MKDYLSVDGKTFWCVTSRWG